MKTKKLYIMQRRVGLDTIECVIRAKTLPGLRVIGSMNATACCLEAAGGPMQMKGGVIRVELFPKKKKEEKKDEKTDGDSPGDSGKRDSKSDEPAGQGEKPKR